MSVMHTGVRHIHQSPWPLVDICTLASDYIDILTYSIHLLDTRRSTDDDRALMKSTKLTDVSRAGDTALRERTVLLSPPDLECSFQVTHASWRTIAVVGRADSSVWAQSMASSIEDRPANACQV